MKLGYHCLFTEILYNYAVALFSEQLSNTEFRMANAYPNKYLKLYDTKFIYKDKTVSEKHNLWIQFYNERINVSTPFHNLW